MTPFKVVSVDAFTHQGFTARDVPNHGNEDSLVQASSIFGVIDGATAMIPDRLTGLTGAEYVSRFAAADFAHADLLEPDATACNVLLRTNKRFGKHLAEKFPQVAAQGKYGPSAAVVLVRFHADGTYSYAQAADCFLAEVRTDGMVEVLTPDQLVNLDENGSLRLARQRIREGVSPAEVLKDPSVHAQLKKNREKNNVAFGVLNGEKALADHVCHGRRPLAGVKALVLMSDGMVLATGNGGRAERVACSALRMLALGVRAYYRDCIKNVADTDPHFQRMPRFKHLDDASALVLHF